MWSIYILRCNDDSLYIGITNDLVRRQREHASGKRGAKYLKGRQPFSLVFSHQIQEKGQGTEARISSQKVAKRQEGIFLKQSK